MKRIGRLVNGVMQWTEVKEPPAPPPAPKPAKPGHTLPAVFDKEKKPRAKRSLFKTDLTEPLVGWKAWLVSEGYLVGTVMSRARWEPDEPMTAKCIHNRCKASPNLGCACGIYAADTYRHICEFEGIAAVAGEVFGWGRYVLAERGWRAQYVYPVRFIISRDTMDLIPTLMKYHVPIYSWQPVRIYDPREDGYEHWKNEENWDFRTIAESDAHEDF